MMTLVACFVLLVALGFGIREVDTHQKNVDAIPIRINVNGSRGKSTVTRLIAGAIMEADIKAVGKMTGTKASMFYWHTDEEKPIIRRLEGPNIREQKVAMKEAADVGAEAFVSECMAVSPDYQRVFQENWMQANLTVIVNVVEDHMEVMGPTLEHVVDAFKDTIPYNGKLVISPSPHVGDFKAEAEKRGTEVYVARPSEVPASFLKKFPYMIFPENVSLALAVAEALGIDSDTAARGMLRAKPAPGVTWVTPIVNERQASYFVNGFSANEPESTMKIWKNVVTLGYNVENPVVVMNCRNDRPERTQQFVEEFLPYLTIDKLVLIGEGTAPVVKGFDKGSFSVNTIHDFEGAPTETVYQFLKESMNHSLIFGIGNYHGAAVPLIEMLENRQESARDS